ncbi:MAG: Stp1/IreP family PP2C-type Ser/Thr phosphatase [Lachnospiraceae bacterium]|nr:Stp1/IreP family PP2C-type Ser/Thr phosphatase [Lachnospiraceae bacterium]
MLKAFSITDIGRKRKLNQDYVYTSLERVGNLSNVFIVADGMGGHKAGDYASRFTVETVVEEIAASYEQNPEIIIGDAIEAANRKLRIKAAEDERLFGMGTTFVAATVLGQNLKVANVGDSRAYHISRGLIRQITRDHSLVEEMVRMGGIDRETARRHVDKNIITRAVGATETVDVDFFDVKLSNGDILLMCSDGLTNMVSDEDILAIVLGGGELSERAGKLIDTANENGGRDNIAVVLVEYSTDKGDTDRNG